MEEFKKAILVRNGTAVGTLGDKYFSNAPIGVIQAFSGQTAPHGYLLADGTSYKVADYPDLYAVIGNTYGGDTENFNVPNLVDKFIQGSTTSGTEKEAGLPNIAGETRYLSGNCVWANEASGAFEGYSADHSKQISNVAVSKEQSNAYYFIFDASRSNPIYGNSDTVQPPALTMVYIIKAFHTNEGVDSGVSDDVIEYVNDSLVDKADKSYVDDNFATMDKVNDLGSYINGVKLTPTTDGNLENQVDIGTIKLPKGKWIIFASGWNPTDTYGSEIVIGLKGSVDYIRQYNTVMFNFSAFRNVTTETTYTLVYSQGSGTSKNVTTNYNFYAVKVGF